MPSAWDIGQEKKLLLAIIDLTNPKAPQWPHVAEKMGNQYSAEACRQHYQKIRRLSSATGEAGNVTSPSKRSATTPVRGRKRKLVANVNTNVTNDDSEQEMESPSKKIKDEEVLSKACNLKIEEGSSAKQPIDLEGEDG
ncbi:MAG: hypothetical protein M1839_009209 [Geoglossum umbratile]|nr:MAG: hypothetical protein M1839_009209 [Geoglossum umbratile]